MLVKLSANESGLGDSGGFGSTNFQFCTTISKSLFSLLIYKKSKEKRLLRIIMTELYIKDLTRHFAKPMLAEVLIVI